MSQAQGPSRLEQLQKLAELSPDDPLTHYAVGLELLNLERYAEAVRAFDQALGINSGYVPAYYHKARAEIRAGRREAARETLRAGMQAAQNAGDSKTVREMKELLDTIA
jgi:tetratricopeptide (TPR) repeat protein